MDNDVRRVLLQHEQSINSLLKASSEASKRQAEEHMRKAIDTMSQVQGKQLDRAAAYTNLMLIGGYAGAFTIWSNVKSILPVRTNIIVASLIGISLATFIAFEIYKMVVTGRRLLSSRHLLVTPVGPEEFAKRLGELQKVEAKLPIEYMRLWIASLIVCVGTILVAISLLGYNFFATLIGWSFWPA